MRIYKLFRHKKNRLSNDCLFSYALAKMTSARVVYWSNNFQKQSPSIKYVNLFRLLIFIGKMNKKFLSTCSCNAFVNTRINICIIWKKKTIQNYKRQQFTAMIKVYLGIYLLKANHQSAAERYTYLVTVHDQKFVV